MITLEDIDRTPDAFLRIRGAWALLYMRHVLRTQGSTPEHARKARVIVSELRARGIHVGAKRIADKRDDS